jgi:hypothetical protein
LTWGTGEHRFALRTSGIPGEFSETGPTGKFDFCPFFGVDRNRGRKRPTDPLPSLIFPMRDDKTVNSLDMSSFENYAQILETNRLTGPLGQDIACIGKRDATDTKNVEMED